MTTCRPGAAKASVLSNQGEWAKSAGSGPFRVAMGSLHTSPLDRPGTGDAGGMNVYLKAVALALGRVGVEVDLYTRATDAAGLATGPVELAPGVAVHRLAAGPLEPLPKDQLPGVVDEFARRMASGTPADVIHSHYWLSGLSGEQVAAEWGVPHMLSLHTVAALKNHTLAPGDQPEPPERLRAEQRLVGQARGVVAISAAERDAIVQLAGADPDRVAIVTPGVDGQVFRPGPGPTALPPALRRAQGYALMIGRIQPIKGQDLAIRAIAALPAHKRPALVITGAPSGAHLDYARHLKALAAQLGVVQDVVFLGVQPPQALANLIRGALVTLMPSRSETYGLVALESAACGTPVIASDTTGLRSSVADGVSGLLLASRAPEDWAKAISLLAAKPRKRSALARGGIDLGRRHTWDASARQLLWLYRLAVGGSTHPTVAPKARPRA